MIPGFHTWFVNKRADKFKSNLVLSARRSLDITGRFYTNGLESAHHLQKKFSQEEKSPKTVTEVNLVLRQWCDEFYNEAVRAIRGLGKYRLANGYDEFFVEPTKWSVWSPIRRQQHVDMFLDFKPTQSQLFQKPAAAGLKKAPRSKRRSEKGEPELFVDRVRGAEEESRQVTPIKMRKIHPTTSKEPTNEEKWAVLPKEVPSTAANGYDPLNPDRSIKKAFYLVHRRDKKNAPISVKRCHSCKRLFSDLDWVLVKTEGNREYTNKQGKQVEYRGNVYMHYLRDCLAEFQQNFQFSMITVLRSTLNLLPRGSEKKFADQGCILE